MMEDVCVCFAMCKLLRINCRPRTGRVKRGESESEENRRSISTLCDDQLTRKKGTI